MPRCSHSIPFEHRCPYCFAIAMSKEVARHEGKGASDEHIHGYGGSVRVASECIPCAAPPLEVAKNFAESVRQAADAVWDASFLSLS